MTYSLVKQPHPVHPRWGTGRHPGFKDLAGKRFGRLLAVHYCGAQQAADGGRFYPIWACQCDCGETTGVWSHALASGRTQSCGCLHREMTSAAKSANLVGQTFGRLTVLDRHPSKPGDAWWTCRCACGGSRIATTDRLMSGKVVSCGCLSKSAGAKTHGKSKSPEYVVWKGMRARCLNPRNPVYPSYGGRGITICDRWLESFEAFLADMGERPDGMSIDRINNDGNYEPGNCRWATLSEQAKNRRQHTYGRKRGADGQFIPTSGADE